MTKEEILAAIKTLPEETLQEIKEAIVAELKERMTQSQTFEFTVEFTNDPRKGVPFVALLKWDPKEKKVVRNYFDLEKTWGKKQVTVRGTFMAHPFEVIEMREGGSWKNDYRYWYVVSPDGKLIQVAYIGNSTEKARVISYLRGEISYEELVAKQQ